MAYPRILFAALALCACDARPTRSALGANAETASAAAAAAPVLTVAVQLRRFQADSRPVGTMADAARTRDTLVQQLISAIERRDTAAVRRLHLSRAEYAYLYYPSAEISKPPYELDPESAWFLLTAESDKGVRRALDRLGSRPFGYAGYTCAGDVTEGANRIWRSCVVRRRGRAGSVDSFPLFGAIIERHGRFKFVNYWNKL